MVADDDSVVFDAVVFVCYKIESEITKRSIVCRVLSLPLTLKISQTCSIFTPRGPQNHCCGTSAELHRERSAAADATAGGYGEIPPVC